MNIITNEKMEISEIHKSVAIRDSDNLWYCEAHGGELKVETKEGEESEFIIQLPVVWITDLTGLKDYTDEYYYKWKNGNPWNP